MKRMEWANWQTIFIVTFAVGRNVFSVYDASGSIGRRYARADEIGVPYCITVDHDSLSDNTVTLRSEILVSKTRVSIDDLPF
jgi:glycyl-tRNA synthetase